MVAGRRKSGGSVTSPGATKNAVSPVSSLLNAAVWADAHQQSECCGTEEGRRTGSVCFRSVIGILLETSLANASSAIVFSPSTVWQWDGLICLRAPLNIIIKPGHCLKSCLKGAWRLVWGCTVTWAPYLFFYFSRARLRNMFLCVLVNPSLPA